MNLATSTRRSFLASAGVGGLMSSYAGPLRADAPKKGKIRVGILHSLTGSLGPTEMNLRDAEVLAIEEINAAGGVLGKQIEAITEDGQSKFTDIFPDKAKKLLIDDGVAVVFGCWTSVSRKVVLPVFEENNGLLFYPAAYEGNEQSPHVVYAGSVPNQHALPAVDWLLSKAGGGRKKLYLLGSDYIFPRTISHVVKRHMKAAKLEPAGDRFVPIGHLDFEAVVADIKKSGADAVLSSIIGDSNIPFFGQLRKQGVKAEDTPVCSLSLDEDDLRGLDADRCKGHLAAQSYFQSVATKENRAFVQRFRKRFRRERVVNAMMESAYSAVHLWKAAAEKAKSTDVKKVVEALPGLTFAAPGGKIEVDPKNQHVWKPFRMGKIGKDGQFEILHTSAKNIQPAPYKYVKG
jgi:urea transport system substrate-binding protein